MAARFQETKWKGNHLPSQLSHISTKNPNSFLLYSELWAIEQYVNERKKQHRDIQNAVSSLSGETREKLLEKFAPKINYNKKLVEQKGLEVLGKRPESDPDTISRFYQECGLEYSARPQGQAIGSMLPLGKLMDETRFSYESLPRKRNDNMRVHDPRIRGMMRLADQLSKDSDYTRAVISLLGSKYTKMLDDLMQSLVDGTFSGTFSTEETITNLMNEILENKKMQKRSISMMEASNNVQQSEVEIHEAKMNQILTKIKERTSEKLESSSAARKRESKSGKEIQSSVETLVPQPPQREAFSNLTETLED